MLSDTLCKKQQCVSRFKAYERIGTLAHLEKRSIIIAKLTVKFLHYFSLTKHHQFKAAALITKKMKLYLFAVPCRSCLLPCVCRMPCTMESRFLVITIINKAIYIKNNKSVFLISLSSQQDTVLYLFFSFTLGILKLCLLSISLLHT